MAGNFAATTGAMTMSASATSTTPGITAQITAVTGPMGMAATGTQDVIYGPFAATTGRMAMNAQGTHGVFASTYITNITLTPSATGTNVPITFGHAFKAGDVPANISIELNGKTTQFNVLSTHADGSCRHAVLTAISNVTNGVAQVLTLQTRAPVVGSPILKTHILSTVFDASASLNVGGTVYSMTARELLAGTTTPLLNVTHISGPYCSEYIVGAKLRNGGTPHAHLAAYFHVRAYSSAGNTAVDRVRCDVVVENGWTFTAGSTRITHNPTIVVAGSTVFSTTNYAQDHHTKFHATGWWGGDPQIKFKHNSAYLISTKQVPNYEQITLKEQLLSSFSQTYTPGGNSPLRTSWGDTGDHAQIGPFPDWDAAYIISGDARALNVSIAASKAGGSFCYHYRDENTGYPVSIDTHPTISYQDFGGGLVEGVGGQAYVFDEGADASAHAPLLGYLAYLATGDYIHLEELHFETNWFMIWNSTSRRTYLTGPQDGIVGYQNRGQAWGIRNLVAAAAITPDTHTMKSYFTAKANNNITEKTANWASPSKNIFGHVQDLNWDSGYTTPKVTPFENDFMAMAFGWAVELGFTNAVTMRNWLGQSPAGRLGQNGSGYCATHNTPYAWYGGISPDAAGLTFYSSWATMYAANRVANAWATTCPATHDGEGYPYLPSSADTTSGFFANLRPALAYSVDAGVANLASWNLYKSFGTNDYTYSAKYDIVPRSLDTRPAWYLALVQNQAKEFTGILAESVDPCDARNCNYSGTNGFEHIMAAWCSAIYDTKRDRLIHWGGGHNGYGGNEQVAFNLLTSTWERIAGPATTTTQNALYNPDGTPAARHTYGAIQYDPIRDQLISGHAGSTFGETGGSGPNCDVFNYVTGVWTRKASHPNFSGYATNYGQFTTIDNNGDLWLHPDSLSSWYKFNTLSNTWATYSCDYNYGSYATAAFDTRRNRIVVMGDGHFTKTDTATPTVTAACGGSPPSGLIANNAPGWVYDPVGDRFIGWAGGQTLHTVDAATLLTWGTITVTGATLPTLSEGGYEWHGTFGKFRYSLNLHGIVLCVQTDRPPCFIRL